MVSVLIPTAGALQLQTQPDEALLESTRPQRCGRRTGVCEPYHRIQPPAQAPYQPHRENQDIAFPCLPHFPTYSRTFLSLRGMCGPLQPPPITMPHYRFSPRSKKYFVGQFVARISYLESCPLWVAAKRSIDESPPVWNFNTLLASISKLRVSIYWPSKDPCTEKCFYAAVDWNAEAILIIRKPVELL